MYNKNNLAIAKVASRSGIKQVLQCVAFYGDRTVATDSFRMIEMSAKGDKLPEPELFFSGDIKKIKLKKGETIEHNKLVNVEKLIAGEKWPDVDVVLKREKEREHVEIKVNAEYLEEILSVLKNVNKLKSVTLKVPTAPGHALIIEALSTDPMNVQVGTGLLMPFNK